MKSYSHHNDAHHHSRMEVAINLPFCATCSIPNLPKEIISFLLEGSYVLCAVRIADSLIAHDEADERETRLIPVK